MQLHPFAVLTATLTMLALPACRAGRQLNYSAAIDPSFSADQMEDIAVAVDGWKASIPELQVTTTVTACDSPSAQQVCMRPVHAPPDAIDDVVGTTLPGIRDSATVLIYVDRIQASGMDVRALTKRTAAHELGHAMGLRHSTAGTLMAGYVPEQAQTVTQADVTQFWNIEGN
jgi:predicted Zn-dependent protease